MNRVAGAAMTAVRVGAVRRRRIRLKTPLIAVAAGLALTASTALAADIDAPAPSASAPPPAAASFPLMNWTGFYVGVNGGLGADRFQFFPRRVAGTTAPIPGDLPLNFDRGLAGLQLGYNWQFGRQWLVGLEIDLDGSDIQTVQNFSTGNGSVNVGTNLDRFATVRPRLGFAVTPTAFVYLTSGLFCGHTSSSVTSAGSVGSFSNDMCGWVRGGGLEYALTDGLSFKTEYIYLNSRIDTLSTPAFSIGGKMIAHTLKAGLNVKARTLGSLLGGL